MVTIIDPVDDGQLRELPRWARGRPGRGLRPRDTICPTPTPTAPGVDGTA